MLRAAELLEAAAGELLAAAGEADRTWVAELRVTARALGIWAGKVRAWAEGRA